MALTTVEARGGATPVLTKWERLDGKQPHELAMEQEFHGLGTFEFLQEMVETEEGVGVSEDPDPQKLAPKRLECSCHFVKANVLAEPNSDYHKGTPDADAAGAADADAAAKAVLLETSAKKEK